MAKKKTVETPIGLVKEHPNLAKLRERFANDPRRLAHLEEVNAKIVARYEEHVGAKNA